MAGEIEVKYQTAATVYALVRNKNGLIWNGSAFEVYLTANYASYVIQLVEQGVASGYYTGTFPTTIIPGVYNIVAMLQTGGSPLETDRGLGEETFQWNGSSPAPLSDTVTSGQFGQSLPARIARGTQFTNFPFFLVSSADHITPFTSGVCSGQISRDGTVGFTALQSGAFTETGLGSYVLQALTSGDLLCNAARLIFTATGISGGTSDPAKFTILTQKTSGQ